jgi:hypothetical protein
MKRVRPESAEHPKQDANEKNRLVEAAPPQFHGKPPGVAREQVKYRIWKVGKYDADLRFRSSFVHNCQ